MLSARCGGPTKSCFLRALAFSLLLLEAVEGGDFALGLPLQFFFSSLASFTLCLHRYSLWFVSYALPYDGQPGISSSVLHSCELLGGYKNYKKQLRVCSQLGHVWSMSGAAVVAAAQHLGFGV